MRRPGNWMQLPTDGRILEILESGLILSPQVIAKNIDKSRVHVNRRLTALVDYGLVVRVERGYYEIAEDGVRYLEGDLDANSLETDE